MMPSFNRKSSLAGSDRLAIGGWVGIKFKRAQIEAQW